MIFAPTIAEVNPSVMDLFRDPEPIVLVGHPADDAGDGINWDALAEEAAIEAAWDCACDLGYLPC